MKRKEDIWQEHYGRSDFTSDEHFDISYNDFRNSVLPPDNECIKTAWPYYAPADSLPAKLPTMEEISQVALASSHHERAQMMRDGYTFRVNDIFMVRFSNTLNLKREAENMLFVQQNSEVRVPKLYAAYTEFADPIGFTSDNPPRGHRKFRRESLPAFHFLVMEYIGGCNLYEQWKISEEQEKIELCKLVAHQLSLLHAIPAPSPSYYGRVYEQPFGEFTDLIKTRMQKPLGPYSSYADFATALADSAEFQMAGSPRVPAFGPDKQLVVDNFRAAVANCDHTKSTFSYVDFDPYNLLIQPTSTGGKEGEPKYEVVLINWAYAAWLPAWFEAMKVLCKAPVPKRDVDRLLWNYHVTQGFKPFPHRDAVYMRHMFELGHLAH